MLTAHCAPHEQAMVLEFLSDEGAVATVDGYIEKLFDCKPLTEAEVRQLCERVRVGRKLSSCATRGPAFTLVSV